jgi:hypothetical protein
MKFSTWLENRTNTPLKHKGFDPRLPKQTKRSQRRWNDFKEKQRKLADDTNSDGTKAPA